MKTVIMAGGKGTRIKDVASNIPKPMIPIAGKPVLEHQILTLRKRGIRDICIVVGYMKDKIMSYFGDGNDYSVKIRYIVEDEPLGTAGALSFFRRCDDDILLINGDIIFDVDIDSFFSFHKRKEAEITLFTHPNSHPNDSVLIEIDDENKVISVITKEMERHDYENRVNAGLHLISPKILKSFPIIPEKKDLDRDIVKAEIEKGNVYAYDSTEYVHDMGTPERFKQVGRDIMLGLVEKKNKTNKQRAVFLDRDGTINEERGFINQPNQIKLLPEAAQAISILNKSEYLVIVVTNQPVIARGECTFSGLKAIHNRLYRLLGDKGAFVDDLYFCPHHPDKGFEGEVKELKIECECRKPKPGMLLKAASDHNIDLSRSWIVGDSERDFEAGEKVGCISIKAPYGLTVDIANMIVGN